MTSRYKAIWIESAKSSGTQNFFDYFVYRRISTLILIILGNFRFSPNYITSLSIFFSLVAGYFLFYSARTEMLITGVILMNVSLILDTLDGQYSRLTNQQSEFGGWYDGVSDCLKYIFLFVGLTSGLYYVPHLDTQWFSDSLAVFSTDREIVLLLGMFIIANFFMIYYVHVSRYQLSFNSGTLVSVELGRRKPGRRFHFGIESSLYTLFTIFLLAGQTYWLVVMLACFLPALWLYPFYLTYRRSKQGCFD